MITAGERIVNSINYWLKPGPLGDTLRGEDYRKLISAGQSPPIKNAIDIGKVKTSCAVFARGILHDANVQRATGPAVAGWPMFGGWLGPLSYRHPSWVPFEEGSQPTIGSLFYIESGVNSNNNHVGFFVSPSPSLDGSWITAEGGGGDGTKCAYHVRTVTLNQQGRLLKGWFDPEKIAAPLPDTAPLAPGGSAIGPLIAGVSMLRWFIK